MKKRILSMILAMAMIVSLFAGLAVTASAAEGTYVLADAIAVGDTVIMGYADKSAVLTDVAKISSNMCGISGEATFSGDTVTTDAALVLTVEQGSSEGSFAFKTPAGKYLTWTSGNTLNIADEISDNASWNVTITEGVATIINVAEAARYLQFNASSPRFCAYKNSGKNVGLYKLADGEVCLHENATSEETVKATCTEKGEVTFTCSCGTVWTESIPATGHNYVDGEVITYADCVTAGEITVVCTNEGCGDTKTKTIDALGHDYVDGICTRCGEEQAPAVTYVAINLETITAGNYIIAAVKGDTYPTVYPATKVGADVTVSDTAVTANAGVIASTDFADGVLTFAFAGNNTDGFAISTVVDGETKYLGVSDYAANRKLAWGADYASTLWTVEALEKGGYVLKTEGYVVMQNSATATAIRGYKTVQTGTSSMGLYLFVETAAGDICYHENTTEIPAVGADCTTPGNTAGVVCADCGITLSGNETIPALGHTFEIAIVDGTATMVCSICGATEAVAMNTLAEAKAYTDKTVVYNVKGIVTYVSGRTVYIEDANDGLCVYFAADFDTSALNLGDEIFVSSTMTTYNTLHELNAPAAYYVISTGNALPENTTVTLADLFADTENAYLGERVTISGLTVGTVNAGGSTMLTDAAGNSIALHKATGVDAIITEGDVITLTAIVSIFKSTYQLIVNPGTMDSDITVTTEGGEVVIETVAIADAKLGSAGEYYQVEGVVTAMSADKRTIYIQDATGGIALYLSAKPAEAVCAIGDLVKGYGAFKAYNGLIELDGVNAADSKFFEILSSGNAVEAQIVTIVDLVVDTDNEYLAEKVAIEGAVITDIATNGTVTLDQNGTTITIYKAPALAEDCVVGATVNVTAVVSCYNGYQLLINDASDVVFVNTEVAPEEVSIKIGHTLNLASDISINFAVATSLLANYTEYYLECTLPVFEGNTQTGTRTVKVEPVLTGNYYYFTLTGITAINMNDVVEARLYMTDGTKNYVSGVDTYSVATYAYSQLNKAVMTAELKALCADLLRYGAAAQTYKEYRTDALVDAAMTETHKSFLSNIDAVTFGNNKGDLGDFTNNGVKWVGRGLDLNSKVIVKFIFSITDPALKAEDLTAKVTYVNYMGETVTATVEGAELYAADKGFYSFSFDSLLAAELRTVMNAVIYHGETRLSSTCFYSVDTYGNGKTGNMLALCKALVAYSDTALAYFKSL